LVPALYLAAYLPFMPLLKSYSFLITVLTSLFYPSSYWFLSFFVALRALIIRITSLQSVCITTRILSLADVPIVINLTSPIEWKVSGIVSDKESPKIVDASSNAMPCFLIFNRAFLRFHSNRKLTAQSLLMIKTTTLFADFTIPT